ncbi:BolA family protein [Halovulum sp. GXIMD14793]
MKVADTIRMKLEAAFAPEKLEVHDESEAHRGHAGYRDGGESHFAVHIKAAAFRDLGRVARQRAVYQVLRDEMNGPVHALALTVEAP